MFQNKVCIFLLHENEVKLFFLQLKAGRIDKIVCLAFLCLLLKRFGVFFYFKDVFGAAQS